jgi:hypothetical protein
MSERVKLYCPKCGKCLGLITVGQIVYCCGKPVKAKSEKARQMVER